MSSKQKKAPRLRSKKATRSASLVAWPDVALDRAGTDAGPRKRSTAVEGLTPAAAEPTPRNVWDELDAQMLEAFRRSATRLLPPDDPADLLQWWTRERQRLGRAMQRAQRQKGGRNAAAVRRTKDPHVALIEKVFDEPGAENLNKVASQLVRSGKYGTDISFSAMSNEEQKRTIDAVRKRLERRRKKKSGR
jgi:hypothetical protein